MKFYIETYDRKQPLTAKRVYRPGWYGGEPYFKVSAPYEDNIGRQHLTFTVIGNNPGCHPDAAGKVIGMGHVPAGYRMIEKERYEELLDKEKQLMYLSQINEDNDW